MSDAPMTASEFAKKIADWVGPLDSLEIEFLAWRITDYAAAIRREAQVQIEDAKDIGRQTAEAILHSYLTGGMSTGFVHELTLPMLKKWKREAQAEALEQIMDFLDAKTPEDADTTHWAARAYQAIGALMPQSNYRERIVALARDNALEEAALISDKHWPESGHVPREGAVSCAMSTSIEIRRLKTDAPKEGAK